MKFEAIFLQSKAAVFVNNGPSIIFTHIFSKCDINAQTFQFSACSSWVHISILMNSNIRDKNFYYV